MQKQEEQSDLKGGHLTELRSYLQSEGKAVTSATNKYPRNNSIF